MNVTKRILSLLLAILMLCSAAGQCTLALQADPVNRDGPDTHSWSAKWIWNAANTAKHNWLCLRKEFVLDSVPESAVARIAADSRYFLWINGELVVYEGSVKRGPTADDCYYDQVELAPYLRKGENTVAVLAWYFGDDSDYYSYRSSGAAGFLFEAQIGEVCVVSDKSWRVHKEHGYLISSESNDPGSQPNYRLAEGNILYDATLSAELDGWYLPDYDDSAWQTATEHGNAGDAPWGALWQRSIPLLRFGEMTDYENPQIYSAYTSSATTGAVKLAMKLPYNMQIQPYLEIEAPKGLKIEMISDGSHTVRASYITKEGRQSFECYGWMSAQTLTYSIPAGVKVIRLGYRPTGYDTDIEGAFTCDDVFYNRLWEESAHTLYVTMRDNYMDCPDRERAQWWGDVTNESHMTFYALGTESYQLYRKGVDTMLGWRGQTGDKNSKVLPTVVPINSGHFELPMQQLAGIVGFYTYYRYTGEQDIAEQVLQPAAEYLSLWDMGNDGLVAHRAGSWDWPDHGENYDVAVMENAWYYWACDSVLRLAEVADRTEYNDYLAGRMLSIEKAFERLWNEDMGGYYKATANGKPDDRGNALAVLSGLADESKYPAIAEILKTTYNATPYMEKYVLDAMFAMGEDSEALTRMKNRYRDMVADEWTTLWEVFPLGGSHNHAWSGGPLVNLSANVAGIAPDTPGYDTYHVIPQLGKLNEVSCTVPSVKGDITVDISRTDSLCTISLVSPANTQARVGVPRSADRGTTISVDGTVLFENGAPKASNAQVKYLGEDAKYIYFTVPSGKHTFTAAPDKSDSADSYTLSIDATAGGCVKINGEVKDTPFTRDYPANTKVTVEALPAENALFSGWSGSYGAADAKISFEIKGDTRLFAGFAQKQEEDLHLIRFDADDGSDVRIEINGITYDLPHLAAVKDGGELTVTAVDGENRLFGAWGGDLFSAQRQTRLTNITEDMTLRLQDTYRAQNVTGVLSKGAAVTVDSEYAAPTQWRASNLTDGFTNNDGGATTTHWYASELTDGKLPDGQSLNVTLDLGKNRSFDTVRLYPRGIYSDGNAVNFPVDYNIWIQRDGSDEWVKTAQVQGQENPGTSFAQVELSPVNARYVRIEVTRLGIPYAEGLGMVHRLQLSELEVVNSGVTAAGGTLSVEGENGAVKIDGTVYSLPCELAFDTAERVAIEPIADKNYAFAGWDGDITGDDTPLYADISGDLELSAVFESTQGLMLRPSENLALGKKVTATDSLESGAAWSVNNLTDGLTLSCEAASGYSTNILSSTDIPAAERPQITVDLGENTCFNTLTLYPRTDLTAANGTTCNFPLSYEVQVRADGEKVWRTVHTVTDADNPMGKPAKSEFHMQNARYVRITVSRVSAGAANESSYHRVQLAEAELYCTPKLPEDPAIGGSVSCDGDTVENAQWSKDALNDGVLSSGEVKGYSSVGYPSPVPDEPISITLHFPQTATVDRLTLFPCTGMDAVSADSGITPGFPTKFTVQVLQDGKWINAAQADYGTAEYDPCGAPQTVKMDKAYRTDAVRLVVYRLGQSAANEQSVNKYRLLLAELYPAYLPDPDAEFEDTYEGQITVTPDMERVTVAEDTLFTAAVTPSDLTDNGIIWSVENADGTPSDIALLRFPAEDEAKLTPLKEGEAYLVARFTNGLNTASKTHITVDFDADALTVTQVRIAAIGKVTLQKEPAIKAARDGYEALSDEQKALVTNLDVLEAAEAALAELKAEAERIYTVTFMNGDEIFEKVQVKHGKTAAPSHLPERQSGKFTEYSFDKWVDENGRAATLSAVTADMTVYASYTARCVHSFTDLESGRFYETAVEWALMNGIMNGTSDTVFAPNDVTNRAMIVTVLYRLEGEPDVSGVKLPFDDIGAGAWYEKSIAWAYKNNVVNGKSATAFDPTGALTREQFATILYRYAKEVKGIDVSVTDTAALDKYTDKSEVSAFAAEAMLWANVRGLIGGTSASTLSPKGGATRAQMATILHRYSEMYA